MHFKQGRIAMVAQCQEVLDGNDDFSWAGWFVGRETRKVLL